MPSQFTFSGGLEYHPSGLGAWQITLDTSGQLRITHRLLGASHTFAARQLPPGENTHLWTAIETLQLSDQPSSTRTGLPDESRYEFSIQTERMEHKIRVWSGDVQNMEQVKILLIILDTLIEKYAGQKPYLR